MESSRKLDLKDIDSFSAIWIDSLASDEKNSISSSFLDSWYAQVGESAEAGSLRWSSGLAQLAVASGTACS